MTSLDVAPATSSPVPTLVTKRTMLWQGGIVDINIPKVVRTSTFDDGEKKIPFIQFAWPVKRGLINFFIHTDNPDAFAGKTIRANAKIYRKEHEDGRSFLYVDLEPVGQPATCRLILETNFTLLVRASEVIHQIQTPYPLEGIIVIAKLKPTYSDDALDLRLERGWEVVREDSDAVYIKKGDKTLTHRKIKHRSKR